MPRNFWMVVQSPENFEISKRRGFNLHGLTSRQRRRAQRMEPDDRMLFYVAGDIRKWAAIAAVAEKYFEDRTPVWESDGRNESFPYRVKLAPKVVLDQADYIDAMILAPRLEYLKRWPPERWPLAFVETLHLLPQRDFRLIEGEMKRVLSKRRKRRRRGRSRETARAEVATVEDAAYSAAEGPPTDGSAAEDSAVEGSAAGSK